MQRFIAAVVLLAARMISFAQQCKDLDCPLATRGTATITVADLVAKLDSAEKKHRPLILSEPKQLEQLIDNMLLSRQLANEARKRTANVDDPVLAAKLQLSQDDVWAVVELNAIRAARVPKNFDRLAREHYAINKDTYMKGRSATVRHLLIAAEKPGAQAKAEAVFKELSNADAKTFEARIAELSDDPGKTSNKGVYTVVENEGTYDPAFAAAALTMVKPGQVVGPIKSQFGYHIMQLIESAPARPMTFEEVKPQIVETVSGDARRRVVSEYRNELSMKGSLQTFPENLEKVIKAAESRD